MNGINSIFGLTGGIRSDFTVHDGIFPDMAYKYYYVLGYRFII